MKRHIALLIGLMPLIVSSFIVLYAYGASPATVDNTGRREYTYCPLSDSDVKSFGGEIDGCPLARVYVDRWNSLTPIQQSNVDSLLRSKGFVDSGEHTIK